MLIRRRRQAPRQGFAPYLYIQLYCICTLASILLGQYISDTFRLSLTSQVPSHASPPRRSRPLFTHRIASGSRGAAAAAAGGLGWAEAGAELPPREGLCLGGQ